MPNHVYGGLRLLKDNVSQQWLVATVEWLHIEECDFVENGRKAFNLDLRRATHLSLDDTLVGSLQLNHTSTGELAQPLAPSAGQHKSTRPCIHENIELNFFIQIERICDHNLSDDSSHLIAFEINRVKRVHDNANRNLIVSVCEAQRACH